MTVTIKGDKKNKKICPLMTLAVAMIAHQGRHPTPASQTEASIMCLGEDCQLWWFCSGSIVHQFDDGDSLVQVGNITDKYA